jgi:thiol-disulfide isomerase/thioredoxin
MPPAGVQPGELNRLANPTASGQGSTGGLPPSPTPFQPITNVALISPYPALTTVVPTRMATRRPTATVTAAPAPSATLPGYPAAGFNLAALNAGGVEQISLESLKGKPLVLNFFATWCSPCRQEIPLLARAYTQNQERVEFVAIDLGEPAATVKKFIQTQQITYPVLLDPEHATERLYRVRGIPTTYFLDADGRIVDQHLGVLTEKTLQQYLNKLTGP